MENLQKIGEHKLKSAKSGDEVDVKTLWEKQACVITFFRRWGCAFCRLAAKDLNRIKPLLDANNVRLIGVGVEELGVEDFMKGNFFDGEVYIDTGKKCYNDLGYKRFGMLGLIPALASKTSRDAIMKSRSEKVGGDMKGDKYQVGGTLVISKGGSEVLLNHKQEGLADHCNPNEILKSLGIEAEVKNEVNGSGNPPPTCNAESETCEASG